MQELDMHTDDVLALPQHEVVHLFPPMTEEEQVALERSIRKSGVLSPVVVWRDYEKEKTWLIDGRNRAQIVKKLKAEGVEKAEDGSDITLPARYLRGSEFEMIAAVLGLNRERRHLSSGQVAAITVKSGKLVTRYARRGKIKLDKVSEEDMVTRLAEESGTSRAYLYEAMRLEKEAPDLLDATAAGSITLPKAMQELRQRKADVAAMSTVSESATLDAPVEEPAAESKKLVVHDGLDQEVPEEFEPPFATRDTYRMALRKLRDAAKAVTLLAGGPGGKWLPADEVGKDLNRVIRAVKVAIPHALCPSCRGTGRLEPDNPKGRKQCEACQGRRYVTKQVYDILAGATPAEAEEMVERAAVNEEVAEVEAALAGD